MSADITKLEQVASQLRRDALRMVHGCKSGHPGGSLGCADYFTALYFHVLKHNTDFSMNGEGEDIFLPYFIVHLLDQGILKYRN